MTSAQGQAYVNVPTPFGGHPWPGQPANELADPSYETVPQELYDYVEHLKRVWPHRHRFELAVSAPEEMCGMPHYLDSIDQQLSHRLHDELVKRRHVAIAVDAPVWRSDLKHGPLMRQRLVTGWSVPAPDSVKFG